jgi:hypothetical protein
MDAKRLDEIKARLEAATPGPWSHTCDDVLDEKKNRVCWDVRGNDAYLIANAPTDLRDLIAEVERLGAENSEARKMLDGFRPFGCGPKETTLIELARVARDQSEELASEVRRTSFEFEKTRDLWQKVTDENRRIKADLATLRATLEAEQGKRESDEMARHLRIALVQIERSATNRDRRALGTVNETFQPLVDAFMGWVNGVKP